MIGMNIILVFLICILYLSSDGGTRAHAEVDDVGVDLSKSLGFGLSHDVVINQVGLSNSQQE